MYMYGRRFDEWECALCKVVLGKGSFEIRERFADTAAAAAIATVCEDTRDVYLRFNSREFTADRD